MKNLFCHWTRTLAVASSLLLSAAIGAQPAAPRDIDIAAATQSERVSLSGHVLPALANATLVTDTSTIKSLGTPASTSDSEALSLTLVFNRDDEAGFQQYLHDVYDSTSPTFRHFLPQAELAERFGPSQQAYDQVLAYLAGYNLQLVQGSENRMTVTVRGTRSEAESAFGVRINSYKIGERNFFANDSDPSLPEDIAAHVQAVTGLSNLATPHPPRPQTREVQRIICQIAAVLNLLSKTGQSATVIHAEYLRKVAACRRKVAQQNATQSYLFNDPPPPAWQGADGTGQTIGLLEFDTFNLSDVSDFIALAGLPAGKVADITQIHVNGGAGPAPGANQDEVLLDIDVVLSFAPGAKIRVYDGPFSGANTSFQAMFNAMIGDHVDIISNSWAYCEDQTTSADVDSIDTILQSAAASGISVFNGSGDSGSTCLDGAANTIGVPADSPSATAVGGTSLTIGPADTYGSETWWNGSNDTPPTGQGGFGLSKFFARPTYQSALNASTERSIPDVSINADPAQGFSICNGSEGGCPTGALFGGTSMAAPTWAAMTALLNQTQGSNLGALNPQLYPLAGSTYFHEAASMGSDFAHVGLGSPRLAVLHQHLTNQTTGPVDTALSQVRVYTEDNFTLPPASGFPVPVFADGTSKAYVIVKLVDANANIIIGKTVTLAANSGNHATITPSSGITTGDNGAVVFTVTDLTVEPLTFTATDTTDGIVLTDNPTSDVIPPPAASGGIVALTGSATADGTSSDTITVTLQDSLARPSPGKLVHLSQTGSSVIAGPNPSVTNASGQIQFTVTDTVQQTVTYTAVDESDGNLAVPGSAQVTFSAGGGDNCGSTHFSDPNITAADGYAITPFATGFVPKNTNFGGLSNGCRGASGLAFDSLGNLYVSDLHTGNIYKFGPAGGVAGAGTLVTATALGPGLESLTFGHDGKLYGAQMATTGNFFTGAVIEINPSDGTVVRTVAPSITCASFVVTDPISGDLFVDDSCAGGGSEDGSIWRISNPGSLTPTTTVYATTPGINGGLTFSPGGTIYVLDYRENSVAKIGGTNTPQPAQKTVLPGLLLPSLDIAAMGTQPNGDAKALILGTPADPSGFPAGIKAFDISTNPVTTSSILVNNAFANVDIVGPDGCLYASMAVAVYKITNADGSCPLTLGSPVLSLGPTTISPNPAQGTAQTFTATFHYTSVPAGTFVLFVVSGANMLQRLVLVDGNGNATFSYNGVNAGTDTIVASATVNSATLTSNPARVTWLNGLHATSLDLNLSPSGGTAGKMTTLSASLFDLSLNPAAPIAGVSIHLAIGSQFCDAVTNASGTASCSFVLSTAGNLILSASFAGNGTYLPASVSTSFLAVIHLDVDGNGSYDALTDGLLIFRGLAGLTGASLVNGAIGADATRTTSVDVVAYLDALRPMLDVDHNGIFDPATDGLMILRYMFGLRGDALIAGAVGTGATRTSAADIEAYIQGLMP